MVKNLPSPYCRYWAGFLYFAGLNFGLTFIAAMLCVVFAPTAAGPGIPEIKAYLNGVDTPNMFGAPQLIVKVTKKKCHTSPTCRNNIFFFDYTADAHTLTSRKKCMIIADHR